MDLLDGRSILVADDEPIIGLDIADALRGQGATVVSAHNVKAALALAATADLSAAVLDINLAGEDCSLICHQLAERSIPFLFHTGYTAMPVLDKWPDAPVLRKPAPAAEIMKAIASMVDRP
jgi:CheY-like chemotaxis protein